MLMIRDAGNVGTRTGENETVQKAGLIGTRHFFIKKDAADTLRLRIRFLAYEAHVDLLEIVSFTATVNLAFLCIQTASTGLSTHTWDYLFRFLPAFVWAGILVLIAGVELWASLFDHLLARCWVQFAAAMAFTGYAVLVIAKAPWIVSPRDYIIFGAMAALAHIRLRSQVRAKYSAGRRKKYHALSLQQIAEALKSAHRSSVDDKDSD